METFKQIVYLAMDQLLFEHIILLLKLVNAMLNILIVIIIQYANNAIILGILLLIFIRFLV